MTEQLFLRQSFVLATALIYWGGVLILASRVRRRIGRSPNLKPTTFRERYLWISWSFVISAWVAQPVLLVFFRDPLILSFINFFMGQAFMVSGIMLALSGYAGTLWCYAAIGSSWRIGIDRNEKTELIKTGPYKFIRHPIYSFQVIIILGMACLLPTPLSFLILFVNTVVILIKSIDEEAYLLNAHGAHYKEYCAGTGRYLPGFKRQKEH